MRPTQSGAVLLLAFILAGCGADPAAHKTNTTLAALTENNTSAAANFPSQINGNLGANNVSKVNVHSLLYPGATTKVLAHLMLWFGQPDHMNVGYSSADPEQVHRQISDMISRGIDGVIVDWYGPDNYANKAAKLVMQEAEKHPGFTFAVMVDAGAIRDMACSGCSGQEKLVQLLKYVEQNYFPSSAYLRIDGQPVVTNFNIDSSYTVDWQKANAELQTPPRFLFQDQRGFSHAMSDGSYSWVMATSADYGLGYLSSFYDTGLAFASKETVGAAYKGFNDALASWGSGRRMDQRCGQTWLATFSQANRLYNSGKQLPYLQLVTWNDYEEGTEIESGIDGCVGLEASVAGNTLEWNVQGNENTVDHYNVYSSPDGRNLKKVAETKPGVHSVDLCSLSIGHDHAKLFVQAEGKPSIANRMPGPVQWDGGCGK